MVIARALVGWEARDVARSLFIYETVGLVSRQEVKQALAFAKTFVEEIRLLITGQPSLKLEDG